MPWYYAAYDGIRDLIQLRLPTPLQHDHYYYVQDRHYLDLVLPGEARAVRNNAGDICAFEVPAREDVVRRLEEQVSLHPEPSYAVWLDELHGRYQRALDRERLKVLPIPDLPFWDQPLYDIQTRAIDTILRERYVLLSLAPGVGKTRTALYAACVMHGEGSVQRWLVLCPAGAIQDPWVRECNAFDIPHVVWRGGKFQEALRVNGVNAPLVIGSQHQLLSDLEAGRVTLSELMECFDGIIYDEPQMLGNPKNVMNRVLRDVRPVLNSLVELNGTPIENDLRELFEQVDILRPGLLGTFAQFLGSLGVANGRTLLSPAAKETLVQRLAGTVFVADLEDIGKELPPLVIKDVWCPMTPRQQAEYARLERELRESRDQGAFIRLYTRLQQVCNTAGPGHSGKEQKLFETLPHLRSFGRKALVQSQFERWLTDLAGRMGESGARPPVLHGGLRPRERHALVTRFKTDPSESVLFGTATLNKALNLQQSYYACSLDLFWSGVWWQYISRCLRGDTDHRVVWVRFRTDTPYENRKYEVALHKRELLCRTVYDLPELLQQGILTRDELLPD